jgi:hypothetical protein
MASASIWSSSVELWHNQTGKSAISCKTRWVSTGDPQNCPGPGGQAANAIGGRRARAGSNRCANQGKPGTERTIGDGAVDLQ